MRVNPEEKEKVRSRVWRAWMKIFIGLGLVVVVLAAGRLVLVRDDYGRFRQFCKSVFKGQPLTTP